MEPSFLDNSYNSSRSRHPDAEWPALQWFDFLDKVIRKEPVAVRGFFGGGLKAIAKAMNDHDLIEAKCGSGPVDGLGAMIAACVAARRCAKTGEPLSRVR